MERDLARTLRGKISPVTTQATGPQEEATVWAVSGCSIKKIVLGVLTEEDVDADEGDQCLLSYNVLDANAGTNTSNDELADSHANGAEEQKRATTPSLNEVKTRNSRSDVDGGGDHRNSERVRDAGTLEERGAVVEDEVDTSELLESLEEAASCETLAKVAAEAVKVRGLAQGHLVLVVGHDLAELLDNGGVVDVQSAESGKRLGGTLGVATLDVHARSLREDEHAEEDNKGPGELNGDGDAVAAGVIAVLGGVVDNCSQKKSDCDCPLVGTNNGSSDPFRRSLGLVKRNQCRNHADTVASEEASVCSGQ
jgi:hypothetical protein